MTETLYAVPGQLLAWFGEIVPERYSIIILRLVFVGRPFDAIIRKGRYDSVTNQ